MNILTRKHMETFLNEFMLIENKSGNNIIAHAHYRETFNNHLPKFFDQKEKNNQSNEPQLFNNKGLKNIVIIGAGYGGLTAALHLARLLKEHVFFQVHLIDKFPFHTIKTQLYKTAECKAEVSIPLYKILKNKNIQFHIGEVKSIDVENKIVQIDDRLLPYLFLIIAMGSNVNYFNISRMADHTSKFVAGRVVVNKNLQAENNKHIYAIGNSANIINPVKGKSVPVGTQFVFQQGRSASENIYAEIFGKAKKHFCPKVFREVVGFGKHLVISWLALPIFKKVIFVGFLGSLFKTAIKEKHISMLRKESRKWITC